MKQKMKNAFMRTAEVFSELSHARRLHVGAIVVKDDRIISIGYNGMPAGWDNNCEDVVYDTGAGGWISPEEFEAMYPYTEYDEDADESYRYGLKTKPEVLHAESNAIAKLAKSTESGDNGTLFVTHSPCLDCAKLIYQTGIKRVYYKESYRDDSGINFLLKSGVYVEKLDTNS